LHLRSGTTLNHLNSWTWDFVLVLRRPTETTRVIGNWLPASIYPLRCAAQWLFEDFPDHRATKNQTAFKLRKKSPVAAMWFFS
jgi:hypothetical protein